VIWDVPSCDAYPSRADFYWTVIWQPPEPRGRVPIALNVVTYWRPGGPRQGTWAQLVEAWRPSVETECGDCQETIWLGSEDSAVVARVVDGRVVLTIQGAAAIARIFPTVPDSVTLIRRRPGTDEEEITIVVERSQP